MSGTWLTSDEHYFHKNVIKYCDRPFRTRNPYLRLRELVTGKISEPSVLIMNEALIRRHNEVVGPTDDVFHLGDFTLWKHGAEAILKRLSGKHHLILGNHDWPHPVCGKKKADAMRALYHKAGFDTIEFQAEWMIADRRVTLHHMPFAHPDNTDDQRYLDLRPTDMGQVLLHGHVHCAWKTRGRQINVGVDVWDYRPASLREIEKLVRAAPSK